MEKTHLETLGENLSEQRKLCDYAQNDPSRVQSWFKTNEDFSAAFAKVSASA